MRGELGALRRPQVLLTLLVGIVGFGGMFAALQLHRARGHRRRRPVPGHGAAGPAAGLRRSAGSSGRRSAAGWPTGRCSARCRHRADPRRCCSPWSPLVSPWAPRPVRRRLPRLGRRAPRWRSCLQMRLMETAGEAQMLGAALNHSALNLANAPRRLARRARHRGGPRLPRAERRRRRAGRRRAGARWRSSAVLRRRTRGRRPPVRDAGRRARGARRPLPDRARCNEAATLRAPHARADIAGAPGIRDPASRLRVAFRDRARRLVWPDVPGAPDSA